MIRDEQRKVIEEQEDVDTREVAEWMYRTLDRAAIQLDTAWLTGRNNDARKVNGVYALEVYGDGVSYLEIHTSDGSIFDAHIGRKS